MPSQLYPQIQTKQSDVFLESEGDGWFERNQPTLANSSDHFEIEVINRTLKKYKEHISNILEIGCSNGKKLHLLAQGFDAVGYGIEPSNAAITSGKQNYPGLNLEVATASQLPYDDNTFDFVYFGFCLYLVDRHDILKAVAEADRVLKSGGFLAILDFDPSQRHKRAYHHRPGIFSYKSCYSEFFTAGGHYCLVAKESFSHSGREFTTNSDDRIAISILYKEPDPY